MQQIDNNAVLISSGQVFTSARRKRFLQRTLPLWARIGIAAEEELQHSESRICRLNNVYTHRATQAGRLATMFQVPVSACRSAKLHFVINQIINHQNASL